MNDMTTTQIEQLKERAKILKLYGLINQWEELTETDYEWINKLVQWEETQRHYRSLERRLNTAKLGRFKMLADFDWGWLKTCDRGAIEDLRGVAIFAKACFGHPSPSKRQKLNATANAFGAPIRPRHLVPTQQGVGTLAPNDLTPCRMAFYFVSGQREPQLPSAHRTVRTGPYTAPHIRYTQF